MNDKQTDTSNAIDSRRVFQSASPEVQKLIRLILQAEREVMHMKRRSDIYERIVKIIKTEIR